MKAKHQQVNKTRMAEAMHAEDKAASVIYGACYDKLKRSHKGIVDESAKKKRKIPGP